MDDDTLVDLIEHDLVRAMRPDGGDGQKWCECRLSTHGVGARIVFQDGRSPDPETLCARCGGTRPVRVVSNWQCWQCLLVDLGRRTRSYELYTRTDPPHSYARFVGMTREERMLLEELVGHAGAVQAEWPDDSDAQDVVRVGTHILDTLPIFEPDPDDESLPEYVRWAAKHETPPWKIWVTCGTEFNPSDWRQL